MPRGNVPRFIDVAHRAWRGMTLRQWGWTTAIALVLYLANFVGVLPAALNAVPIPFRPQATSLSIAGVVGSAAIFLAAAYCFLLAVSIAEYGTFHRLPPLRRYVAAGLAACSAAIAIELTTYAIVPGLEWNAGPLPLVQDPQRLLRRIVWSATSYALTGGLALAVYVRFRSARLAREAFNAAELERVGASRAVLASRLAATQARIEPAFLLGILAQVEELYERDPQAGDRMLDSLIGYLRAALPQLRSQHSTLRQEMQLAESYLRIMQIRMGSRLSFQVDFVPALDDCDFPPMVLLPLVELALRDGLEPLPHGGKISIAADIDGDRLRVRVADDGSPRSAAADDSIEMVTLRERLRGLFGTTASLDVTANASQGIVAAIEVSHATARSHR